MALLVRPECPTLRLVLVLMEGDWIAVLLTSGSAVDKPPLATLVWPARIPISEVLGVATGNHAGSLEHVPGCLGPAAGAAPLVVVVIVGAGAAARGVLRRKELVHAAVRGDADAVVKGARGPVGPAGPAAALVPHRPNNPRALRPLLARVEARRDRADAVADGRHFRGLGSPALELAVREPDA